MKADGYDMIREVQERRDAGAIAADEATEEIVRLATVEAMNDPGWKNLQEALHAAGKAHGAGAGDAIPDYEQRIAAALHQRFEKVFETILRKHGENELANDFLAAEAAFQASRDMPSQKERYISIVRMATDAEKA